MGARLVVDDTDELLAVEGVCDAVETVDESSGDGSAPGHVDGQFEAKNGEGCQTAVCFDKQAYVADEYLAVDELETVEVKWRRRGPRGLLCGMRCIIG